MVHRTIKICLLVLSINMIGQVRGASTASAEKPENTLKIGTLLDLSSNIIQCTGPLRRGMEIVFDQINQAGGIQGKMMNLVVIDDKYEPDLAREGVLNFINNYKIDILLSPVGSPTLLAYLDLVKEGKVLVLFPTACDTRFRSPDLKYIIHCRASYGQESAAMAQYAYRELKARKIALFYQNDIESVDGAVAYFKKVEFKDYELLVYDRKSTSFAAQAKKIKDMGADAILLMCIPSAGLELLRQIGAENLFAKNLICWSSLTSDQFQRGLNSRGLKAAVISALPNQKSDLPLAQAFRKAAGDIQVSIDQWQFEGFINATIFHKILEKVEGSITKESIIAAAEKIKDLDIGGLILNFDPKSRTLSSKIWIVTSSGEWIEFSPEP